MIWVVIFSYLLKKFFLAFLLLYLHDWINLVLNFCLYRECLLQLIVALSCELVFAAWKLKLSVTFQEFSSGHSPGSFTGIS